MDGAGKSTQIEILVDHWRDTGLVPVRLWARGGYTPGMEWLKRTARRCLGKSIVPAAGPSAARTRALSRGSTRKWWLRLAILDLIWLYAIAIRWWRWRGRPVVCDRYWNDTELDFELNFPQEQVRNWWLWKLLRWSACRPTHQFLLLIPVDESMRRSVAKNEPFPDSPEVLQKRLAAYESWRTNGQWHLLDGRQPREDLAREIASHCAINSSQTCCSSPS